MKFLVGTTQFLVGIFLVGTFFGTAAAEAATLRQPDTTVNCTYLSMIISEELNRCNHRSLRPPSSVSRAPGEVKVLPWTPLCKHPR